MSGPSFSPRFIPAKLSFRIGNDFHAAGEHLVNPSGVAGFDWDQQSALELVGTKTEVRLEVLASTSFELSCDAYFSCETSKSGTQLGLVFVMGLKEKNLLAQAIEKEGILPEYARKYPRIPFTPTITMMPALSVMKLFKHNEEITMACDVDDFSPSGFQVSTEDPRGSMLEPGKTVAVQLQPRGSYKHAISANTTIQRVICRVVPETGNFRWHFGMSIHTISGDHKAHFAELLRLLVEQMRKAA